MDDTMIVNLCVNNPNNGVHTGYLRAVDFGGYLSVWAYYPAMTCRLETIGVNRIRIGRKRFRIISHKSWYGNWCWDAVRVDLETANAIAEHVRQSGKFQPENGLTDVWDMWREGEPIRFTLLAL